MAPSVLRGPGAGILRWTIAADRFHHTGLTVTDLERSLAFYRDLLGLEVVSQRERRGGVFAEIVGYPDAHAHLADLRAPGSEHLIELIAYVTPEPRRVDLEPALVGVTHVCLAVEDLRALYERLLKAGVDTFFTPPVEFNAPRGGGLALYLRDPDGIVVELYQPEWSDPSLPPHS